MRHYKNRRGGDGDIDQDIKNIEMKLNLIQDSVDKLKEKYNNTPSIEEPVIKEEETIIKEDGPIQETIPKPWQEDKNIKFKDGQGGRVTLSFPRIILLLSNNVTQGLTNIKLDFQPILLAELEKKDMVEREEEHTKNIKLLFDI